MMLLEQAEIKQVAHNLVSMVLGEMMSEFSKILVAVQRTDDKQWNAFMDEQIEHVFDVLLNRFGSKD